MVRSFVAVVWLLLSAIAGNAAIAVDATISADRSSASSTVSTPAFSTTGSNELLLAFIATDYNSGTNTTVRSIAGGGLTWVLAVRSNGQSGTSEIWRAFAATTLSNITVTATLSQSVVSSMTVMSFSGVNVSGTNGSGAIGATASRSAASGAPTASVVTTAPNSWVMGVGNDFDRAVARTPGAGQSIVHQYLPSIGDTYWVQMLVGSVAAAGTSVTINDTAPTNDRYNLGIVEIVAAAPGIPTWSISGTITGGASSTVALSGNATMTTTANASGVYSFTGLANGSYTVTPTKSGFTFQPTSQPVTVNGANVTGVNFTAQGVTWSISGTITGGASSTVALSGNATMTTTANASGVYSFTGLANGSYTVTPTKSGFTFQPTSQPVTVNGANVTGVNFTAQGVTWSISGTITGGASSTVSLSGTAAATTTANVSGDYSFTGLANGAYTVTPSAAITHVGGKSATPPASAGVMTITYTPVHANDALIVFAGCRSGTATAISATANGWAFTPITGLIGPSPINDQGGAFGAITPNTTPTTITVTFTNGGNCLSDTTILIDEFSGTDATGGTTTFEAFNTSLDPNICTGAPVTPLSNNAAIWYGCYDNVTGVSSGFIAAQDDGTGDRSEYKILSGGAGTPVTPGFTSTGVSALLIGVAIKPASQSAFTFTPASQNATINNANVTGVNFTVQGVTWSISGTITGGAGTTVALNGTATATTTANASGDYSFTGLANGSYTVTPTKSGFTFQPTSQPVTVSGANVTGANFTAQAVTWSISGTITGGAGSTVALSGTATATTTANASGDYSFTGLANGSYTVTPTKSGFTFQPTSQPVTVSGANVTGANFTAQAVTWSISGTITGGAGSTVALSGTATATTTANASGDYSFTGLANGSYTVAPSKSGLTFTPSAQTVTLNGANLPNVNFTAQTSSTSPITFRQKAVNGNESATNNMSVAFPASNTAGNFLIVTGTAARPSNTITISDTAGNTYLPAMGPITDPAQDVSAYIWYVPNCKSGPNTVTITPSRTSALEVHVSEWSGVSNISPLDQTAFATGTGTNAATGPVTTTRDGELIFGYSWVFNNASAGAGFTALSTVNGDMDEYRIQTTAGNATATFTQASGAWLAMIATFAPSAQSVTWSISGTISGLGGPGATLALSGAASASVIADNAGNYTFSGLADGSYTVTPSNSGYTFTPASAPVTINGANQAGINFTSGAGAVTWSVAGTISPGPSGAGAVVTASGPISQSVNADANGNYNLSQLPNGNYTVTPSKIGYTFIPASQSVAVNSANVSGVSFTAVSSSPSISLDVNISKDGSSASTTIVSPAFSTASGNELLLAFIATDYTSGSNTTVRSIAGGGLTWVLAVRNNAQNGTAEIWRAFAPTPLTNVTVTATLSQSVSSAMTVMSFAGVNTSGTNGSGAIGATASRSAASGAPTASLVATGAGSWVLGVGNDYDRAVARTLGPAQTLVHQYLAPVGDTYWVQRLSSPVPSSGTSVTINDTAPTNDRYNLAIIEVLGSGIGGGDSTPPTVSMTSPAPSATIASLATVSATATDDKSVAGVQFLLDGVSLGNEVTSQPYTMTWNSTATAAGTHTLSARARDSAGLVTTSNPVTVTVDHSGNPAVVGNWSSVVSLPAVAVNLILLPNDRVMFYQDGPTATIWDYVQNTFTSVPTSINLFCSGHALLADGRILVVGGFGGSGSSIGIANAEIFDPIARTWTAVPNMAYRRWYPNATTLPDGRILVVAGWQTSAHTNAGISEIYNPVTNTWTQLTNANNPFETYPFMYVLPDGRVIHVGGSEYATDTDVLDLTTNSWSVVDPNIVDGGSAKMYTPGKFMKAGSAADSQEVGQSSNTTFVLDMTQPAPAWRQTPSMVYNRSFFNLTTLPDGSVLATGGETDKNGGNIANAVYAAELWSPQTQTWSTMSSMHTPREYHGTALLLPDGRVLVSGMGADFGNVPDQKNAEFYSPPYLFKGARPTIDQAPSQVHYGSSFFVGTPDAAGIASATLIRTGAVTHFFDENERSVPLTFTQTTGGLNVTAPANANLAPPGYYMLFIVNSAGVPSIAPFVQVLQ